MEDHRIPYYPPHLAQPRTAPPPPPPPAPPRSPALPAHPRTDNLPSRRQYTASTPTPSSFNPSSTSSPSSHPLPHQAPLQPYHPRPQPPVVPYTSSPSPSLPSHSFSQPPPPPGVLASRSRQPTLPPGAGPSVAVPYRSQHELTQPPPGGAGAYPSRGAMPSTSTSSPPPHALRSAATVSGAHSRPAPSYPSHAIARSASSSSSSTPAPSAYAQQPQHQQQQRPLNPPPVQPYVPMVQPVPERRAEVGGSIGRRSDDSTGQYSLYSLPSSSSTGGSGERSEDRHGGYARTNGNGNGNENGYSGAAGGAAAGGYTRSTSQATVGSVSGGAGAGAGDPNSYYQNQSQGQHYPSRQHSLENLRKHPPAPPPPPHSHSSSSFASSRPSASSFGSASASTTNAGGARTRLNSTPSSSLYSFPHSHSHSSPSPPAPRPNQRHANSLSPRPSIVMSPPLDSHPSSPSPPLMQPPASPLPEGLQHLHQNRSIDGAWGGGGGGGNSPSSATASFFPSGSTLSPKTSLTASTSTSTFASSSFSSFPSTVPTSHPSFYRSPTASTSHSQSQSLFRSASYPSPSPTSASHSLDPSLLSNLALYLRDAVPRSTRSKGALGGGEVQGQRSWKGCFTGGEAVRTVLEGLGAAAGEESEAGGNAGLGITAPATTTGGDDKDRRENRRRDLALSLLHEMQRSLWFHDVEWSDAPLLDSEAPSSGLYVFTSEGEDEGQEAFDVEVPTAVVTELTRCLSPMCGVLERELSGEGAGEGGEGEGLRSQGCYAYACPNRRKSALRRVNSSVSQLSGLDATPIAENWATSVPPSLLESLPKEVIKVQNNIFEFISGEQTHYDDLALLETGFVDALRTSIPPIIPPTSLSPFLSSLLLTSPVILTHSQRFLSALREKQSEGPVVSGIGKIVLAAAVEWGEAYVEYGAGLPMAVWRLKEEMGRNERFREFILNFSRTPGARRLHFEQFHRRPWTRLTQYSLLLSDILKHTDPDARQEREYLEEALGVVKEQAREATRRAEKGLNEVELRNWERDLGRKPGEALDLELLSDPNRKFFMAGKVYRRQENPGFADQFQESHLVLFDNYLVLTKSARPDRDGKLKYPINRRPVPLELVQLKTSSFSEPPISRSSGFHLRSARSAGATSGTPSSSQFAPQPLPDSNSSSGSGPLVYPISFHQLGRFNGLVHLYVETPSARSDWEKALKEAISMCAQRAETRRVVRLDPLADQTFGSTSLAVGSLVASNVASSGTSGGAANQFGKPTCSVPLRTADGLWLVVAGCAQGIFIGWRGRPKTMQQVVHLAGITQLATLSEFSFLLVIANKVLVAYALEALIPSKTGNKLDQASKAPQRLSGQKDVSFFKVGKIGDADPRTLVIYAKKSGVKESVFKALEPVSPAERARGGGGGHRFLGKKVEWFRTYKEFFMPSLVTGLHFQRSKLALIGSRGVEIMDLESMRTMTVPDLPPSRGDRAIAHLAKRCEDATTMGMFRIADSRFLLVYSEFAFQVGRHGEPIPGTLTEWESKPEQVAFCHPYIFAISPTLIEIRNAFTGRLAQFITGSHMSLTYDGSAIASPSPSSSAASLSSPASSSSASSLSGSSSRPGDEKLADDLSFGPAGPIEKRLHVSIRQGAYHVLYEVVVVA